MARTKERPESARRNEPEIGVNDIETADGPGYTRTAPVESTPKPGGRAPDERRPKPDRR